METFGFTFMRERAVPGGARFQEDVQQQGQVRHASSLPGGEPRGKVPLVSIFLVRGGPLVRRLYTRLPSVPTGMLWGTAGVAHLWRTNVRRRRHPLIVAPVPQNQIHVAHAPFPVL